MKQRDTFQAALTFPRQMWGNVINFFAVWRAIRLFIRYLITGKMISWDKTAHHFPNMEELRSYHRKIGDLLLERNAVSPDNLQAALFHAKAGRPVFPCGADKRPLVKWRERATTNPPTTTATSTPSTTPTATRPPSPTPTVPVSPFARFFRYVF